MKAVRSVAIALVWLSNDGQKSTQLLPTMSLQNPVYNTLKIPLPQVMQFGNSPLSNSFRHSLASRLAVDCGCIKIRQDSLHQSSFAEAFLQRYLLTLEGVLLAFKLLRVNDLVCFMQWRPELQASSNTLRRIQSYQCLLGNYCFG